MNGIIEEISETNIKISGKTYYALPAVKPYLKNFEVEDVVEFSTSKNDRGAISFMKAGHVKGSEVPKEAPDQKQSVPKPETVWPEDPKEVLKGKTWEVQVEWARTLMKDLHGVPDRYEAQARAIIKKESERIAGSAFEMEKKPPQPAAKADNPAPPAEKVESPAAPVERVVMQGVIESVTISATINLGNYNNVKLEVAANSGDTARSLFQREIQPTIEMVQGIIRQIDQKGVKI